MSDDKALTPTRRSVLVDMAERYGMEPDAFEATIRGTVCKGKVTREEFAAFLLVAKEYRLNPLTREIYAFPAKSGGIQPIVSVDGWARIINEQTTMDGLSFEDHIEDGKLISITCSIHRKDRSVPTTVTEYMAECHRRSDTWERWPTRMLRHKALIQCARYAFGFSGIVDQDEYERAASVAAPSTSGIASRLTGASNDGFSDAHVDAVELTPEFPDEYEDADLVDAPLEVTEEGVAVLSEPVIEDEPDETEIDPVAWAGSLIQKLSDFTDADSLRAAWVAHKDALKAVSPGLFKELNKAVVARSMAFVIAADA